MKVIRHAATQKVYFLVEFGEFQQLLNGGETFVDEAILQQQLTTSIAQRAGKAATKKVQQTKRTRRSKRDPQTSAQAVQTRELKEYQTLSGLPERTPKQEGRIEKLRQKYPNLVAGNGQHIDQPQTRVKMGERTQRPVATPA